MNNLDTEVRNNTRLSLRNETTPWEPSRQEMDDLQSTIGGGLILVGGAAVVVLFLYCSYLRCRKRWQQEDDDIEKGWNNTKKDVKGHDRDRRSREKHKIKQKEQKKQSKDSSKQKRKRRIDDSDSDSDSDDSEAIRKAKKEKEREKKIAKKLEKKLMEKKLKEKIDKKIDKIIDKEIKKKSDKIEKKIEKKCDKAGKKVEKKNDKKKKKRRDDNDSDDDVSRSRRSSSHKSSRSLRSPRPRRHEDSRDLNHYHYGRRRHEESRDSNHYNCDQYHFNHRARYSLGSIPTASGCKDSWHSRSHGDLCAKNKSSGHISGYPRNIVTRSTTAGSIGSRDTGYGDGELPTWWDLRDRESRDGGFLGTPITPLRTSGGSTLPTEGTDHASWSSYSDGSDPNAKFYEEDDTSSSVEDESMPNFYAQQLSLYRSIKTEPRGGHRRCSSLK